MVQVLKDCLVQHGPRRVCFPGKEAHDCATGVCLTPRSSGVCASTPVSVRMSVCRWGVGEGKQWRDSALLCLTCQFGGGVIALFLFPFGS